MHLITNRQGGDATNWNTAGTTDYVVTLSRFQTGAVSITGNGTVTFPEAFGGNPLVFARVEDDSAGLFVTVSSISTTQVTIYVHDHEGNAHDEAVPVYWQAIGPYA